MGPKRWVGIFLVVAALWGLVSLLTGRESSRPSPSASGAPALSLRTLLNQPAATRIAGTSATETIEKGCIDFWNEVQAIDMDLFDFPPKLDRLPRPGGCEKIPLELSVFQQLYLSDCATLLEPFSQPVDEKEWRARASACSSRLFFLRAGISAWRTRERKLSEITDLRLLADRLAAAFGGLPNPMDPVAIVATGKRILEVDPRIAGAAKAVLMGQLMVGTRAPGGHRGDEEYWAQMDEYLEIARGTRDPELGELELLRRTHGFDPARSRAEGERMVAAAPGDPRGHALQGYGHWKLGNRAEGIVALSRALALAPQDEVLRQTWVRVHAPDADEDAYYLELRLGMRLDSLLQ